MTHWAAGIVLGFLILSGSVYAAKGSASDMNSALGNFDPKTERFTGDHADEANKLVFDPQRRGYEIPDADKV